MTFKHYINECDAHKKEARLCSLFLIFCSAQYPITGITCAVMTKRQPKQQLPQHHSSLYSTSVLPSPHLSWKDKQDGYPKWLTTLLSIEFVILVQAVRVISEQFNETIRHRQIADTSLTFHIQ